MGLQSPVLLRQNCFCAGGRQLEQRGRLQGGEVQVEPLVMKVFLAGFEEQEEDRTGTVPCPRIGQLSNNLKKVLYYIFEKVPYCATL